MDIEAQRVNPSSLGRINSWRPWVSILGIGLSTQGLEITDK